VNGRGPADGLASALLGFLAVPNTLIEVKQVTADGKQIPVLIFRSSRGTIFARCLLSDGDTPIVDGPTAEATFALVEDLLDSILLSRALIQPVSPS